MNGLGLYYRSRERDGGGDGAIIAELMRRLEGWLRERGTSVESLHDAAPALRELLKAPDALTEQPSDRPVGPLDTGTPL